MAEPLQTVTPPSRDAQAEAPATRVSLSRVGVVGVEKIIRVCASQNGGDSSDESLYHADLECFVDLNPEQAGVHMSRFSEVVEDLAEGLTRKPFADIESLAQRMAEEVVRTQEALRAEVHIKAQTPVMKRTPVTHPALQRAQQAVVVLVRVLLLHPAQNGRCLQHALRVVGE